jgi:hypothetical protein
MPPLDIALTCRPARRLHWHAVGRPRPHGGPDVDRPVVREQLDPFVSGHVDEQPVPAVTDVLQHILPVVHERDDEVGLAGAVVVGHPQAEALGVRAQPIDHQRGEIGLQADHTRAQTVAFEPRQRCVAERGRLVISRAWRATSCRVVPRR